MSVRVIAMVFEAGPGDLAQHSVMMALADNADDSGVAWPGHELLARKSRMTERNVIRVLDALERDGWLVRRKRSFGEHRRGNVYELNMARLGAKYAPDTRSPHARKRVAIAATCAVPDDTRSPEPETGSDEVTLGQREVTIGAPRGDMALADLLLNQLLAPQNRHEPSIEPPLPPKPPHGGGIACSLDGAAHASGPLRGEGNGSELPVVCVGCGGLWKRPQGSKAGFCPKCQERIRRSWADASPEASAADAPVLTAEELEDLAECNAIRGRMKPPEPPWSREEWAGLCAKPSRIANPTDPVPIRSRRRRWR